MAKLKLVANPTFRASVGIPLAGGDPVAVEMEFKHRTKTQLDEWIKSRDDKPDIDSFMDMVVAWPGLDDPFTRENVETLLENYIGTALASYRVYVEELVGARAKN